VPRYVCLRWTPADWAKGKHAEALAARLEAGAHWRRALTWRGVIILAHDGAGADWATVKGDYSVVFGALFRRADDCPAPVKLDVSEALAGAESGGATLIGDFFGGYVAMLINHAHDHVHIVRDPTSAIACWTGAVDGVRVVFSDARDYAALGGVLEEDETRLAAFLLQPRLSMRASGLKGVEELHGGERLTLGRDFEERAQLWRPHIGHGEPIADFAAAQTLVRREIEKSVRAWAQPGSKIGLKLSGGLDSTMVLSCLAKQAPQADLVCVNLFSASAPEGDERDFARAAAAHFGKQFLALEMRPEDVDYSGVFEAPLFPAPLRSALDWSNPQIAEQIWALDIDHLLSGQAGDHVFHRSRTPLIAADAAREGLRLGAWGEVALDTAHVSGQSVWRVAGASVKHGWLGRPLDLDALWRRDRRLVSNPDWSLVSSFARHPWLADMRKLPAGQAMRLAYLLDAEHYNDPNLIKTRLACIAPLYSQPIVELIMRIPPRIMTEGGRDRALVRAAFAKDLPELILNRSTKGETTRYFAAILARNRRTLGDILLGGELRRRGFLDVAQVAAALKPDGVSNEGVNDLLICLSAEGWLQSVKRTAAERSKSPDGVSTP
jgi:asparagine synthase (glutamine-hydrolysing)